MLASQVLVEECEIGLLNMLWEDNDDSAGRETAVLYHCLNPKTYKVLSVLNSKKAVQDN